MVSFCNDCVVVPLFFFDGGKNFLFSRCFSDALLLSGIGDFYLITTFGKYAPAAFFIKSSRPAPCAVEIRLIARNDPLGNFFTAILDPAISAFNSELKPKFEISEFAFAPHDKGISLRRVVGGSLSCDRPFLHSPKSWIPVPALESFAIEYRLESNFLSLDL